MLGETDPSVAVSARTANVSTEAGLGFVTTTAPRWSGGGVLRLSAEKRVPVDRGRLNASAAASAASAASACGDMSFTGGNDASASASRTSKPRCVDGVSAVSNPRAPNTPFAAVPRAHAKHTTRTASPRAVEGDITRTARASWSAIWSWRRSAKLIEFWCPRLPTRHVVG